MFFNLPKKNILVTALLIITPFLAYSFYLLDHFALPISGAFTDDARAQIFPFYNQSYGDYIGDYYRTAFSPPGWRILFQSAAYFVDPLYFGNFLGYFLWAITLIFLSLSAFRLGGIASVFGVLLFAIPSPIFFDRMMGGLPRAFAFPIISIGIYAGLMGRYYILFILTPLSAIFYPVTAIFLFIFYSLSMLLNSIFSWSKIILQIGALSIILAISFIPQYLEGNHYGRRLTHNDAVQFPEAGVKGRFGGAENPPYPGILHGIFSYSKVAFMPREHPHLEGLLNYWTDLTKKETGSYRRVKSYLLMGILLLCFLYLKFKPNNERQTTNALLIFFLAIFCTYELSVLTAPYLFHPQRYLVFTLPVASIILIPTVICRILKNQTALSVLTMLFIHFIFGGVGKDSVGFISIKPNTQTFFEAISKLPDNVLIAGWPDGVINNVPLMAKKKVFISYETHQVFHENFVIEMRKRMYALIEAHFSTQADALMQLKSQFGVSHFLIDKRLYEPETQDKKHRVDYFEPFTGVVERRSKDLKSSYLYKLSLDRCIISHGPLCLIEL